MTPSERYGYFVRKVADFQVVWGLYLDGWAMAEVDGKQAMVVWPEREFAKVSATEETSCLGYAAKEISLDKFAYEWLHGIDRQGSLVMVFPAGDQGHVVRTEALRKDLDDECQQYE